MLMAIEKNFGFVVGGFIGFLQSAKGSFAQHMHEQLCALANNETFAYWTLVQ
jgi:hypothetical protein